MTCFRSPYQDELKTSSEVWDQHVHTTIFKMDNHFKWLTARTYCSAQGTLLMLCGSLEFEGSLGEKGNMCMFE